MKALKLVAAGMLVFGVSGFAQDYTQGEIYQAMCQKCHGQFAEGNPAKDGPRLSNRSQAELEVDIYELEGDGYQSSGAPHNKMEYNLTVIENKGMHVDADKMAAYIAETFGKNN